MRFKPLVLAFGCFVAFNASAYKLNGFFFHVPQQFEETPTREQSVAAFEDFNTGCSMHFRAINADVVYKFGQGDPIKYIQEFYKATTNLEQTLADANGEKITHTDLKKLDISNYGEQIYYWITNINVKKMNINFSRDNYIYYSPFNKKVLFMEFFTPSKHSADVPSCFGSFTKSLLSIQDLDSPFY